METAQKKIIFVVTEDWYFWSHRLPMARAARDMGFEVVVATRVTAHGNRIEKEGFRLITLAMERRSGSVLAEIKSILELIHIYRTERPDIVHHIAIKTILYGSFASLFARVPVVANTFAGLGFLFSKSRLARILLPVVVLSMKILLGRANQWITVQNPDDEKVLERYGIGFPRHRFLILGSGVDTKRFCPSPEPDGVPIAAFIGRMIWDKGVGDLVEAARLLRQRGASIRVVLVGDPDPGNPRAVREEDLRTWAEAGDVEWWPRQDDIAELWRTIHIGVLPTFYPEGIPKTLLEGAAAGRAQVATRTPGCVEVIQDGETGFLVPPRDIVALADSLQKLLENKELREKLGAEAAIRVGRFSEKAVIERTQAFYRAAFSA